MIQTEYFEFIFESIRIQSIHFFLHLFRQFNDDPVLTIVAKAKILFSLDNIVITAEVA